MQNLIIVTNEPNIVDRYMADLYKKSNINVCPILNQVNTFKDSIISSWVSEENDVEINKGIIKPSDESKINIIKVPFNGFAYMVAYNRYYQLTEDQNIVISIKENIPTPITPREKYHLFLDGKFNLSAHLIEECFSLNSSNSLLSEDYDFVMDLINKGNILFVSKFIGEILTTD